MEQQLLNEITLDLGANYKSTDENVLKAIIKDVINDALYIANRHNKTNKDSQIQILKLDIKEAVKTIYLQRGTEDVSQSNDGGVNNTYQNAISNLQNSIIKSGKRISNV